MNAYELISSDMAARLGLKRLTLGILTASLATNCLLSAAVLFKKDAVSTVLVPVGLNEATHPLTVSDTHVDQDYLMLVARDLLSLAMNCTPENIDFNRQSLLQHVAPSSFGDIDESLKEQAEQLKRLRASTFFSVESMSVDAGGLRVTVDGVKRHFIGKTETLRQKSTVTMRFTQVAGKLLLQSLTESDTPKNKRPVSADNHR